MYMSEPDPAVTAAQREQAVIVQARLEVLWHKLEGEGMYVGSNTVHMTQELIRSLTGVDWPNLPLQPKD